MTATTEIDLVQDITTDCSVVASLCAGTARAVKGHGKAWLLHFYDVALLTSKAPRVNHIPA